MGCSGADVLYVEYGGLRVPVESPEAAWRKVALAWQMASRLKSMPELPVPSLQQAWAVIAPLSDAATQECLLAGEVT